MRRKGQNPFGRRGLNKSALSGNSKIEKKVSQDADDFEYRSMRQGVAESMNHITKSIMHNRSNGMNFRENDEYNYVGAGNLIGMSGEKELRMNAQENIPMRPLMMNNINNNNDNNLNNNMIDPNQQSMTK